jgi:hypothetical protein
MNKQIVLGALIILLRTRLKWERLTLVPRER